MKLQQEKHELELEVQDAQWRLDHGQAPNVCLTIIMSVWHWSLMVGFAISQEEAELEWDRQAREAAYQRDADDRQLQQESVATDAFAPAQITRTTAEPRPNAYIPDDIGIPKPYGTSSDTVKASVARTRLGKILTWPCVAGALAPFKPSASGRGLSHMRAPRPQPVEI